MLHTWYAKLILLYDALTQHCNLLFIINKQVLEKEAMYELLKYYSYFFMGINFQSFDCLPSYITNIVSTSY